MRAPGQDLLPRRRGPGGARPQAARGTSPRAGEGKLEALVDDETVNFRIAQLVYDARTRAGLTQLQLAKLVGTTQPVIARLEDADYRGHSLRMLRRIAAALKKDLEIRFVPRGG